MNKPCQRCKGPDGVRYHPGSPLTGEPTRERVCVKCEAELQSATNTALSELREAGVALIFRNEHDYAAARRILANLRRNHAA